MPILLLITVELLASSLSKSKNCHYYHHHQRTQVLRNWFKHEVYCHNDCSMAPFTNWEKTSRVLGCFRMKRVRNTTPVTNEIPTQFNENFELWNVMFWGDLHNKILAQGHQLMRKVRITMHVNEKFYQNVSFGHSYRIPNCFNIWVSKPTFPDWQNSLTFPIFWFHFPVFFYNWKLH